MEMLNEIERAEMLHKQLCTNPLWPTEDTNPRGLISELLVVLATLKTHSTALALPPELLGHFQRLEDDAQDRSGPTQPEVDPAELWQSYAVLKKFFSSQIPDRQL